MICGVSQPPKTIKWPPGLAIKIAAGFLGVAPIADMGLAFRGAHVIYAFKHSLWMGLWMVVMSSWMGVVVGFWPICWWGFGDLSALEEKYCHLAKVEVDEMSAKLERSKREV